MKQQDLPFGVDVSQYNSPDWIEEALRFIKAEQVIYFEGTNIKVEPITVLFPETDIEEV